MDKIYKLRAFCTASLSSFNLRSFTWLLGEPRSHSVDRLNMGRGFGQFPMTKFEFAGRQGLHQVVHLQANRRSITNGENDENKNGDMQGAKPPNFSFPEWARWVVGSLFTLLIPFLNIKWGSKIQAIEEAELVVEGVEKVAEVVEKVAEEAEKVSEEVAESLPADGNSNNSRLKQAALWVEKASKATAHDAQLTQDFIHKVEQVEHDLNDLETMVDPIIGKIINGGPKEK